MVLAGALKPLIDMAKSGDAYCETEAVAALANLAMGEDNQKQFMKEGGMAAIEVMTLSKNPRVQHNAKRLISRLKAGEDENGGAVRGADGDAAEGAGAKEGSDGLHGRRLKVTFGLFRSLSEITQSPPKRSHDPPTYRTRLCHRPRRGFITPRPSRDSLFLRLPRLFLSVARGTYKVRLLFNLYTKHGVSRIAHTNIIINSLVSWCFPRTAGGTTLRTPRTPP